VEILNEKLNPRGLPFYEAVAVKGQGVEETLKGVTATVFRSLASKYGGAQAGPAAVETPVPRPAAPSPAPAPPAPRPVAMAAAAAPPAAPRSVPSPAPAAAAVAAAPAAFGGSAEELLDALDAPPAPGEGLQELGLEDFPPPPSAEPEELELEELPAREPELSLEAIDEDEEIVQEDEIAPAPTYSALDEEPARPPAAGRGTVSTAPVSVELSGTPGSTDIAIPVDVTVGDGAARVHLHIRLTLNLKLQR
jgi:hypothetical protein